MTHTTQGPTFGRFLIVAAAAVIVLAGMHLAADFINPILVALLFTLIFSPIYSWLLQRGLPTWLSILVMLIGLVGLFGFLGYVMGVSIAQLSGRLAFYASQFDRQLAELEAQLATAGLPTIDLGTFLNGGTITSVLSFIVSMLGSVVGNALIILFMLLFFLGEGPALIGRLRNSVGADNPRVSQLNAFGQSVVRQFGLRAIVNLVTGVALTIFLILLGVDFPLLWGVLTFFLSYIPYLGIVLASVPPVLLALAEFGFSRAFLVIVGVVVANIGAENVLSPALMGRGLNLSPSVVFISFLFWTWLLGAPGAFVAMPLTILAVLMLDTFPEMRWLVSLVFLRPQPAADAAAPVDAPVTAED